MNERIIAVITDARMDTERRKYRFDPLYSGGAAFIDGFDCPVYIDLATLRVDPAPKALLDHDMERVVGYLDNIENDGTSVRCDVIVGGTKDAAAVFDYEENVAPFVCSIGVYRIEDKDIEFVDDGVRAKVNGREIVGRAAIIHGGSLAEGSFVTIGGDGDARVVRARLTFTKGITMDEKEKELDDAVLDEERATLDIEEAVDEAVEEKVDEKVDELTVDAVEEILADDATREDLVAEVVDVAAEKLEAEDFGVPVEEIKEEVIEELADEKVVEEKEVVARAAKKAVAKIKAVISKRKARRAELRALAKKSPRLASLAVAKGWTMEEAYRQYAKMKARRSLPTLHARTSNAPRPQDVLAASLAITLGMSPARAKQAFKFDERVIDAAESKQYRGATLKTIVAACNNSHKAGSFGVNTNMLDAWGDARRYSRSNAVKASAGFSTINALDVFSNVLQAFLEPTQETAERVWTYVSRTNVLADFNAVPSYLPTLQGRLREISETGAISNITFTTERFENATRANGVNFTIPEMVIINDQIDVFAELLRQFETLGDDCIEHDVAETFWKIIDGDAKDSTGASIVSAARGNLVTGALDEDGLNAALTALASFSNANGTPLRIDRARLLTPMKYAANALKIYNQEYVALDGGIATPNIWKGRFEPFIWQYLDAAHARATKDDGTTASLLASGVWTLIRDPQTRPVVCVNKLVGYESPQVRTFDYDPNVWGLTYQMIYPYSVSTQYADGIVVVKPE